MAKRKKLPTNSLAILIVVILVGIFALMMMIVPQLPTSETTSQSMLDFINWFVEVRSHFETYVGLYALILAVLGVGGYFVIKSK